MAVSENNFHELLNRNIVQPLKKKLGELSSRCESNAREIKKQRLWLFILSALLFLNLIVTITTLLGR